MRDIAPVQRQLLDQLIATIILARSYDANYSPWKCVKAVRNGLANNMIVFKW